MKPHPRIRKTIKWGGAAVTVLLVVVWVGSTIVLPRYFKAGLFVGIDPGVLIVTIDDTMTPPTTPGLQFVLRGDNRLWWTWWPFRYVGSSYTTTMIPLWIPESMSLLATAFAWRLDTLAHRRAKLNLCPKCNYDRTGIARDAKCPECGAASVSV